MSRQARLEYLESIRREILDHSNEKKKKGHKDKKELVYH